MKSTNSTKQKLEEIFKTLDFKIRYEKGTFQSGFCILENQQVIVINKFFPLESKVNTLVEVLRTVRPDLSGLKPEQVKLVRKLQQQKS